MSPETKFGTSRRTATKRSLSSDAFSAHISLVEAIHPGGALASELGDGSSTKPARTETHMSLEPLVENQWVAPGIA